MPKFSITSTGVAERTVCRYSQSDMLILASASPRRHELLTQAGVAFTAESANLSEDLLSGEVASAYVQRLAEEKAQAIWNLHQSADTAADPLIVLGADTCVASEGHILGKPVDTADARRMLELRLQGAQLSDIAQETGRSERTVRRALAQVRDLMATRHDDLGKLRRVVK